MKTLNEVKDFFKGELEVYLDWHDDDSEKRLNAVKQTLAFIYGKDFEDVVMAWTQEELNEFFSALYKGNEV